MLSSSLKGLLDSDLWAIFSWSPCHLICLNHSEDSQASKASSPLSSACFSGTPRILWRIPHWAWLWGAKPLGMLHLALASMNPWCYNVTQHKVWPELKQGINKGWVRWQEKKQGCSWYCLTVQFFLAKLTTHAKEQRVFISRARDWQWKGESEKGTLLKPILPNLTISIWPSEQSFTLWRHLMWVLSIIHLPGHSQNIFIFLVYHFSPCSIAKVPDKVPDTIHIIYLLCCLTFDAKRFNRGYTREESKPYLGGL